MNFRPRESNFSFLGGAADVEVAVALVGFVRDALVVDDFCLVRLVVFFAVLAVLMLLLPPLLEPALAVVEVLAVRCKAVEAVCCQCTRSKTC